MKLDLLYDNQPLSLTVERDGDAWRVRLPDGSERHISAQRLPDGLLQIQEGNRAFRAAVARLGGETHISYDGQLYVFEPAEAEKGTTLARKATGDLTAPMAGVVADVLVQPGDQVTAYQAVAVVEAMKVMATVEAQFAGRVAEVCVAKGQRVAQGEKLVVVVPLEVDGTGGPEVE
jgi:biotin carboxyl carrier protein